MAAVQAAAKKLGLRTEPTVVYVADALAFEKKEIPYPVIAGLTPARPRRSARSCRRAFPRSRTDEVILLDWPNSRFDRIPTGAKLRITYFHPDVEGEGKLEASELTLRGYLPLSGAARDPNLTPEIKGVTDARANLFDWDRPPVLPKEKIRERVPNAHPRNIFYTGNKATPMAYVNLATARKLFRAGTGRTRRSASRRHRVKNRSARSSASGTSCRRTSHPRTANRASSASTRSASAC